MAAASKALHWTGLLMTLPFAVLIAFKHDPGLVKDLKQRSKSRLPDFALGVWSAFRHITFISLLLDTGYFACALSREYGLVEVAPAAGANDWLDVYFTTSLNIALFVGMMFWSLLVVDIGLLVDPAELFRGHDLTQPWVKWVPFQMAFGPDLKGHECEHRFIREIQRQLHTRVPLLLVADAVLFDHVERPWSQELWKFLASLLLYLCWNLSCWRYLRIPGYPVQKRLHDLGPRYALAGYLGCAVVAVALSRYSRALRAVDSWWSALLAAPPLLCMVWANFGFAPFRYRLARLQGIDPRNIWGPSDLEAPSASETETLELSESGSAETA